MQTTEVIPVEHCKMVSLPRIGDYRGDLSFIEGNNHIPFPIERVYYLYDVPHSQYRGAHAHKRLQQLIVAVAGSFNVSLDDGYNTHTLTLNNPARGLLVHNLVWRELFNFSMHAVCLVLASRRYEESDYYRDYDEFLKAVRLENKQK